MKSLSVDNLILFHEKIIKQTGGASGIRDLNLIEGSLNRAFTTFDGVDLYNDLLDKISVNTYSLIKNHGFIDGNKRIGVAYMTFLLKLNGIDIKYTQQDLISLGLEIAEGKKDEKHIKDWINKKLK